EQMRRFSGTVFDEFIDNGAVTSYSSVDHMTALANGRQIGLIAICSQPGVVGGTTLTVALEHSADGKSFVAKTNGVLINGQKIGTLNVFSGGEASPVAPSMKYVRLAVTLGGTVASARVRIDATVRGSPEPVVATDAAAPRLPAGPLA